MSMKFVLIFTIFHIGACLLRSHGQLLKTNGLKRFPLFSLHDSSSILESVLRRVSSDEARTEFFFFFFAGSGSYFGFENLSLSDGWIIFKQALLVLGEVNF